MNRYAPILALLALALLSACGTLSRPNTPEITRLYLDGAGAEIAQSPATPLTLLVAVPRTVPGYSTPRIAYMQGDRQLEYYGRHEWTAEPSRMLQPATTRALDRSGRFAAIVTSPSPALADLRLDMEVVKLLHDYRY
ncbi:MAG: ABC-type transport auxiliary lipoprotein family protein, partial [Gammaproteobacteria bacterium]